MSKNHSNSVSFIKWVLKQKNNRWRFIEKLHHLNFCIFQVSLYLYIIYHLGFKKFEPYIKKSQINPSGLVIVIVIVHLKALQSLAVIL